MLKFVQIVNASIRLASGGEINRLFQGESICLETAAGVLEDSVGEERCRGVGGGGEREERGRGCLLQGQEGSEVFSPCIMAYG